MSENDFPTRIADGTSQETRMHRSVHQWLTLGLQAFLVIASLWAIYEGQWMNAVIGLAILLLTLVPAFVGKRYAVSIPPEFEAMTVVFIFASLFLGEIGGYYARFWWWDVLLHTSSGFLLGVLGVLLVYLLNGDPRIDLHMQPNFVAFFAFTFAVAVGALWEILEFGLDGFFGMNMQKDGLNDTMWDLIVDTLGALAVAMLGFSYMRNRSESFIERWIVKFIVSNPRLFEKISRQ